MKLWVKVRHVMWKYTARVYDSESATEPLYECSDGISCGSLVRCQQLQQQQRSAAGVVATYSETKTPGFMADVRFAYEQPSGGAVVEVMPDPDPRKKSWGGLVSSRDLVAVELSGTSPPRTRYTICYNDASSPSTAHISRAVLHSHETEDEHGSVRVARIVRDNGGAARLLSLEDLWIIEIGDSVPVADRLNVDAAADVDEVVALAVLVLLRNAIVDASGGLGLAITGGLTGACTIQ
eukprot:ANDGO_04577.mRNA.1 hypothetical protein